VDRPEDDEDVVASSTAGQDLARRTEAQPAVGRTAWDFADAMGASEHASRVLRELDPVEVIALAAYAYVLWRQPDQNPGLLWFLLALAAYHLVLRPLARLGLMWLYSRMRRTLDPGQP
jgi:hypothetical protein